MDKLYQKVSVLFTVTFISVITCLIIAQPTLADLNQTDLTLIIEEKLSIPDHEENKIGNEDDRQTNEIDKKENQSEETNLKKINVLSNGAVYPKTNEHSNLNYFYLGMILCFTTIVIYSFRVVTSNKHN